MTKFVVFLVVLIGLGIIDVAGIKKRGLTREIFPYFIIAIVAGIMGAAFFLAPYRDSVIGSLAKYLHVSE